MKMFRVAGDALERRFEDRSRADWYVLWLNDIKVGWWGCGNSASVVSFAEVAERCFDAKTLLVSPKLLR